MPEDSDIVKRVLSGDVDSFRILVERYQRPVLSMIQRMIRDRHRCEEIGQDAFFTAFQKLSTFDPTRSQFSTWLFTIARNMSINALKKKLPLPMEILPEMPVSRNPSHELSDKEIFIRLFGETRFRLVADFITKLVWLATPLVGSQNQVDDDCSSPYNCYCPVVASP